jgi:uncharacterized protein (TIGR02265 family)
MQRLHFEQVVDGLWFRALKPRISPSLRAALKEKGLDLDKPLEPAYPAEKMHEWVALTAAQLYPTMGKDDALKQLGVDFFRGYTSTFIGAAMKTMMRVLGVRRSLERMERNFRTGNNFMQTRFTPVGTGEVSLWFNDVNGLPAYYAGMLEEGGRATGAADIKVTWTNAPEQGCTYQVRWKE